MEKSQNDQQHQRLKKEDFDLDEYFRHQRYESLEEGNRYGTLFVLSFLAGFCGLLLGIVIGCYVLPLPIFWLLAGKISERSVNVIRAVMSFTTALVFMVLFFSWCITRGIRKR